MIILKTKRSILRTWKEQDLDPMSVINQDPFLVKNPSFEYINLGLFPTKNNIKKEFFNERKHYAKVC